MKRILLFTAQSLIGSRALWIVVLLPLSAVGLLCSMRKPQDKKETWVSLLDKDLSQWETYLSYRHRPDYNGNVPKDSLGAAIRPVGYNQDSTHVFSVSDQAGGPVLRVSGEIYGCLFTRKSYKNYHLKLQVKWGMKKYQPREDKLRDSGILYHSQGEAGVEYWRSWMLSQEFQIMEGHMGDFWCQANSAIDIRSFPSEGAMNCVADPKQPFSPFSKQGNYYCMRSENHESPSGQWNTLELVCFEGKSLHIVNGKVVMVLKNSRAVQTDGRQVPLDSGRIQLQSEAAEVFYRNIQIRPLASLPPEYAVFFQ